MSTMYNPMNVMMGRPGAPGKPYVPSKGSPIFQKGPLAGDAPPTGSPTPSTSGGYQTTPAPQPPGNVVGPESVRATGTGPFDSAYRQDLATFAGGLFNRPGGNLSFNPTSNQPFGGQATGGGNAPVLGMPNTLLQNALGGNPFTYTPPPPASTNSGDNTNPSMQDWLNQLLQQGNSGGPRSFM